MFDSPFEFCAICRQYVLLDQTQRQCALEHVCAPNTTCPLRRYFTGIEFGREPGAAEARQRLGVVPLQRRNARVKALGSA
jgi:hypothetical protein